jgi:hypothetical protein
MSDDPGLLLVVPGGLFELVFVPIWLIAKGFNAPRSFEGTQAPGRRNARLTVRAQGD